MYRPMVANPQQQLMSSAVLQSHTSRPANSSAYTIVAAPHESSPQPTSNSQPSTSHPLTTTSLVLTSSPRILTSVPHIITSAPPTTPSPLPTQPPITTTTPTVVNGLLHLKPVQVIKTASEAKKPAMDISCLTKEGVARNHAQTPPPLLQIKKPSSTAAAAVKSPLSETLQELLPSSEEHTAPPPPPLQSFETGPVSREQESQAAVRQDVVLVQTSPPSGMQRVWVVGEKGEPVPQPRMVLPVAYDQQLVSMPIYRVGSSLGGLQPLQVLASLPTGSSATT